MDLPLLQFPTETRDYVKIRTTDNVLQIWDIIRKKWLIATPEEWVRQHTIGYLLLHKYPASLIAVESGLTTVHKQKRSDILVYKQNKPFILVECKAPSVKLSQNTFNQAFNYNNTLQASYIYLTNGLQHVFWDSRTNLQVSSLPIY